MRARRAVKLNETKAERRRSLSAALTRLMKEQNLLQSDLARRMGTTRDNVHRWVNGDTFPRSANV